MSPDEKLQVYHDLLVKWQKAINLVSNSTLDDAMERHFEAVSYTHLTLPTICSV